MIVVLLFFFRPSGPLWGGNYVCVLNCFLDPIGRRGEGSIGVIFVEP